MRKIDYVQTWIDTVSASHSGSEKTRETYELQFGTFLKFIEASAEEIIEDYENMTEKTFKRKYAMMVKDWIGQLHKISYSPYTIAGHVRTVKSFFKYNDLPLGFIPNVRRKVVFHNRDLERNEIQEIIGVSRPREKAFFTMMSQTGLRPSTLCQLQLKHIEPDFSNGVIPCCVKVPEEIAKGQFGSHFTFMGEETVKALKSYFATRSRKMTKDSPIFSMYGNNEGEFCDRQTFTNIFRQKINALKRKRLIDFERRQRGKPAEVRLYNLRKFFRKYAGQAGVDYVNFWMGHKANYKASHIPASDEHYFSREDMEFQRKIYAEKAMPFLRLETATPTEHDKIIARQAEEIEGLKARLNNYGRYVREKMEEAMEEVKKDVEQRIKEMQIEIPKQAINQAVEELRGEVKGAARKSDLERVVRKVLREMAEEKKG